MKPEIHAVVEVVFGDVELWFDMPPEPWPFHVRLSRAATDDEIAVIVATLSFYGSPQVERISSAEALASAFPSRLSGGLAVVGDGRTIWPGCCCGLETWQDWGRALHEGESPWTGHDPAPLVEAHEGQVCVWSDGALGSKPKSESPIVFTTAKFEAAIEKVAADIDDFVAVLRNWLQRHAPTHANKIADAFLKEFGRKG